MELTKTYFENLDSQVTDIIKPGSLRFEEEKIVLEVYQCANCKTIYDPSVGDEEQHIEAGTFYEDLPETYRCALCDSSLSDFVPTEMEFIEK